MRRCADCKSSRNKGGCGDGIDAVDLWMLMQKKRAAVDAYEQAGTKAQDSGSGLSDVRMCDEQMRNDLQRILP